MSALRKYPPSIFHSTDINKAFKIADKTKFANLVLTSSPDTDVIFSPFFSRFAQTGKQQFYGHLWKANPLYEILVNKKQQPCQLIFNATDAYISPTTYQQKQTTHNVVPTWNYVSAQFRGVAKILPQNELNELLEKQVEIYEKDVGSQWRLKDSSPDYVNKLIKSIFGLKIEVSYWKAHYKLSQNNQKDLPKIREWSEKRVKQDKSIINWMDEFK